MNQNPLQEKKGQDNLGASVPINRQNKPNQDSRLDGNSMKYQINYSIYDTRYSKVVLANAETYEHQEPSLKD
jgi:hypothetical protein